MRKLLARVGLATPMVAGLGFGLLLVATPAQAAHHTPQWHMQHYIQCLQLMVSNPAQQSKLCGPFHYVAPPDNNHAPEGLPLPPPPVTTTPTQEPCVPPPCPPPPCREETPALRSLTVQTLTISSTSTGWHHFRH